MLDIFQALTFYQERVSPFLYEQLKVGQDPFMYSSAYCSNLWAVTQTKKSLLRKKPCHLPHDLFYVISTSHLEHYLTKSHTF